MYFCPLLAQTSKYCLNFSIALLSIIQWFISIQFPFSNTQEAWSLFISFLFLTLSIKLSFLCQPAQRSNYFSFGAVCPWFASTSFVYFETKPLSVSLSSPNSPQSRTGVILSGNCCEGIRSQALRADVSWKLFFLSSSCCQWKISLFPPEKVNLCKKNKENTKTA